MSAWFVPLIWFLLIIGGIPLTLWAFKRSRLGQHWQRQLQQPWKILATLNLGPGQRLMMIEVQQASQCTQLILGITQQHITLLQSSAGGPDPTPTSMSSAATAASPERFPDLLASLHATPPTA